MGSPNIPVLRQILRHWERVCDAGDSRLRQRLFRNNCEAGHWHDYCLLADQYSLPREEALRRLESPSVRTIAFSELQFLARVRPGSKLLLEHCTKRLAFEDPGVDMSGPDAVATAEILGSHFGGSEEALARILAAHRPDRPYQKVILALCEGWPSHDILRTAFSIWRDKRGGGFSDEVGVRLVCRVGSIEDVQDLVSRYLAVRRRLPPSWEQLIARPIVRRLSTDDEFVALLSRELSENPTPSKKASIPRLISCARGGTVGIRDWSFGELDRQLAGTPEVGLDIVTGTIRPVVHTLLDVLSLFTA
jgi:hypothetical protein